MIRLLLFGIVVMCSACSSQKAPDPLVGNYVGWMTDSGSASASDGTHGITEKLVLKADGTFHYQLKSRVMVNIDMHADGTYKHTGNQLTLTGTMKGTFDDGYKKSKQDGPYSTTATVEKGELKLPNGPGGGEHSFRKEGEGAPAMPDKYKLKASDPSAIKALEAVAKVYASAKSFTATGISESKGGGFAPEKAKFKLLYQRPSKFRFEAAKLDGTKEWDRTEMTWDGKKCWWYTKEFGETTERPLGNALGIVGVGFGSEADLLPSLLLPHEMDGPSFKEIYPEITFLPTETVNGKRCTVFQMRSKGADVSKLWVEEATGLIARYYEGIRGETLTIDSKMDTTIDPKSFNFGKRSKVGK